MDVLLFGVCNDSGSRPEDSCMATSLSSRRVSQIMGSVML